MFSAPYAEDDGAMAARLLREQLTPEQARGAADVAATLIAALRGSAGGLGGVEDLLHEYALSTSEGVALMTLAEALLRVPDAKTADRFIEDRIGQADFAHHEGKSDAILVGASRLALTTAARILQPTEAPLAALAKRVGAPAIRAAMRQAMRIMGNHFVLGETIGSALARAEAKATSQTNRRYSFDMLGEGARTAADADRYFAAYAQAIEAIGRAAGKGALPDRPGISVKLSALHPRYEAISRQRVLDELAPRLLDLARQAKKHDLNFTVDAEEADRLELSLDVIDTVFADLSLAGWDGFGLAIQAYQKRAGEVIDHVADLARRHGRRMMVRLVKGAYWDTEIKRAQERGLDDYPVFTRKEMTDLNYIACARKLLGLRPHIFPQFASHNALTIATILQLAAPAQTADFEFQRLHGMGEAVYARLAELAPDVCCRTYAPVGCHRDLLAYLVRQLLENGANSSFVALASDRRIPVESLLRQPADIIEGPAVARNPKVPLPRDLYGAERINSRGMEFGCRESLAALLAGIAAQQQPARAAPVVAGQDVSGGASRKVLSPVDFCEIGIVVEADTEIADKAVQVARAGFAAWNATPVEKRAAILEAAADLLEKQTPRLVFLLQQEAGKTLDDAMSEVREAVDFCRYYAVQGRLRFGAGERLPGPTGESNLLRLRGRGVFLAISPWNFPLAIFIGQIVAALVAGNGVVAKPAEQTPLIAAEAVRLLHAAGVPTSALHLVPGGREIGARLTAHPAIDGVVFTGSTRAARQINQTLAARPGAIAPLIAETGGVNAMVVDATALPEQATDDIVASAFRSAGQRCSALRLLFVQEDVADHVIDLIVGAARELRIGDPSDPAVYVGPIIDAEAKRRLDAHVEHMRRVARVIYAGEAPGGGIYFAPHVIEIPDAAMLQEEVFGPVLHVVRYTASQIDSTLAAIAGTGYGLTLGVHTRIEGLVRKMSDLPVGNVYANRNMIGAVVGVQPFGGQGLSGTGPKAGGPNYLPRFATEQTVTINTAAAGGDAALMAQGD